MACDREMMLLISCYADGESTPEETLQAKAHLEQCGDCRKLVEEWGEQHRMFEWTYSVALLKDTEAEWPEEPAGMEKQNSTSRRIFKLPTLVQKRVGLAWAAALTAAICAVTIAGLTIYNLSLPPMLKTGSVMAAGSSALSARMEGQIQLKLGPGTKVRRVDERTIRLEKGWVFASVNGATKLRVLTQRVHVIDQGTRFRVGTTAKLDYVVVEEGSVSVNRGRDRCSVNAGHALIAEDGQKLAVAKLQSDEPDSTVSFEEWDKGFVPASADELDWTEGVRRLATRFPDLRIGGGSGGVNSSRGTRHGFRFTNVSGLRSGLRAHFGEISAYLAGEPVDPGDWEIPVAIIQFIGVSSPELSDDVFYVRLMPKDGAIIWRFIGSKGGETDIPFVAGKALEVGSHGMNSLGWTSETFSDNRGTATMQLTDWPGEKKPMVHFEFRGIPTDVNVKAASTAFSQAYEKVNGIEGLRLEKDNPNLLYLDPERKHWLIVAWNWEAGKQLCRVSDASRQGRSGSVVLAVIAVNTRLKEPDTEEGAYLLRLVLPARSKVPHFTLEAVGAQDKAGSKSASYVLQQDIKEDSGSHKSGYSPETLPNYGRVSLTYSPGKAVGDVFPFTFQVVGRPDDKSTREIKSLNSEGQPETTYPQPTDVWVKGLIRVRKP